MRAKCRWYNEGEKNSECETLYRDLYSSKADCDNSRINDLFFGNNFSKSLNLEEKEKCEGM